MTDEHDEINALISELNASGGATPPAFAKASTGKRSGESFLPIETLLADTLERRGSDLLLVAGAPPAARVDGTLVWLSSLLLDGVDIEEAIFPLLSSHAKTQFVDAGIADGSLRLPRLGRFRINLHRERGRAAAAIRLLPTRVPRLNELNLPPEVGLLSQLTRGLVLVGGATGSGKTTTMAAIVDEINRRDARHIVTVEDPIEYEHVHHASVVEQVEIGADAPDFPTALRAALRQAPDVLVVGEMRDPDSMRIALSAAETGHLVLSSLHTTDVASTVARICDSFPNERQNTIRQELSLAVSAVMTQTLIPRVGGGRIPAIELLVVSYGTRQHIRKNTLQHLHQEITLTRRAGSLTMEDSLARLVKAGLITRAEAAARAGHVDELEAIIDG